MSAILTEVRQAARRLAGSPGYSAGVFLMLTLGLALSVGMYTVLKGVLLNGLPYPGGDRVVHVESVNAIRNESGGSLTGAEALALVDAPIFEHAGWYMWGGETVLSGKRPREMTVHRVSGGYFPALGVKPQVGRWIGPGDVGPDPRFVVLSDEEWGRLADRDPGIIGKPLKLIDETVTVIGVMPPEVETGAGLWLAANPGWLSQNPAIFVNARYVFAVGRLVESVDAQAAANALDALSAQVRMTHGLPDEGWRLRTTSLLESLVGDVRGVLAGVFLVSLVVLAIACANVGSLLAARLAGRERELAIVQALGATSARVWRGMLIELLLLGSLATGAALLLLVLGLGAFRSLTAGILPRADDIGLDTAVLGFAAGIAVLCVLLVALPFGVRLRTRMSQNLSASGKGSGGTSRGSLSALPVAGLALATTALIAGSAVALSLGHLRAVDPGYRAGDVYAIQLYHGGEADELRRFANAVLTRMQSEPEVETVAVTSAAPLSPIGGYSVEVQVPGRDRPEPMQAGLRLVTPGYLEVLSQRLLAGRRFLLTDDAAAPRVAIVNQAFARGVFGGGDAIGREIVLPLGNGERAAHRIVGIAADIRNAGLRNPANPEVLVPFRQSPWVGMTFLVRAPGAGDALPARLQEIVWSVDPEEAITRVSRLQDDLESEFELVSFFTRMLGGFALLATALAAFGTYSVVAFLQRRRTREIGVRLALGAEPLDVARRVLLQGAALAAFAGIGGCLAAIIVLRLLGTQLFGVSAATPALYALGVAGVLLAALLASVAPAWRAARVQPMAALRYE